jgi:hypothetical protein
MFSGDSMLHITVKAGPKIDIKLMAVATLTSYILESAVFGEWIN